MDAIVRKTRPRMSRSPKLTGRAINAPHVMKARETEARILEMMPAREWLSCTSIARLIRSGDDRRVRARLDYLLREGKVERKSEQGRRGLVYLYRQVL